MSLFAELKRRKVFRVVIAYLAGAWILIQVAETMLPVHGIGDAAIRAVVAVLGVCAVPVLVLSWLYQFTPEGLKKQSDIDRSGPLDRKSADSPNEVILAVLPFDNLSTDPEMQFFSDGVSEEIIQRLSRGAELKLIGRTSSFQFRDARKAEAAGALHCSHVLDGSIRRAAGHIRVNAHLVEVSSGTTLWSDRYSVITAEPNRDPRLKTRSAHGTNSQSRFWFPVQPSHRLITIVNGGQLMPEDWQADSNLLISAAANRSSAAWIRFLVEHGADANYVDDEHRSPLSIALKRGDAATARLLAELGANPNVDLDRGNRILHFAAREADYRDGWLLELLLEIGAEPALENDYGQSVSAVFHAHLDTDGKTVARQRMILQAWSPVLEDGLSDRLLRALSEDDAAR